MKKLLFVVALIGLITGYFCSSAFADRVDRLVVNPSGDITFIDGATSKIATQSGNLVIAPRSGIVVLTGAIQQSGALTIAAGNITATAGDIVSTVGNIQATLGSLIVTNGYSTLNNAAVGHNRAGTSIVATIDGTHATDAFALYVEGHAAGTTGGATYAVGNWLNVDAGAVTGELRGLDIGIYEDGANCSGGDAAVLALLMRFDSTTPPTNRYMMRFNTEVGAGLSNPTAWFFASNPEAVCMTLAGGLTQDSYIRVNIQGAFYRIMMDKE